MDMDKAIDNVLMKEINSRPLPRHIAVIMDGNGRWARQRKLPRTLGHQAGLKSVRRIVEIACRLKIPVLTLYAFSVDNWSRPKKEIEFLLRLLEKYIEKDFKKLKKENVILKIIGDTGKFSSSVKKALNKALAGLKNNTGLKLVLALNYGSRTEIVTAAKKIALACKKEIEEINEENFSRYLQTKEFPDPDLLIRTSGEKRLSNFLLWQVSYAELFFTDKLWPDFNQIDLIEAIIEFQKRKRRYGGL